MKTVLVVSSSQNFLKNIRATIEPIDFSVITGNDMPEAIEGMRIKQFDVVIIHDESGKDGAYSKVLSITEAVQTADGMGQDFFEPEHVVVVTRAFRVPSAGLGAHIIDQDNIGALIPFLNGIK